MTVALVHDYLTQCGGAERVVLELSAAFPGAPLYTSLYAPDRTFPEFVRVDVRTLDLNRVSLLRRRHRAALPVLAPAFSRLHVRADVAVCSSSGWAHGAQVDGRKVVYCHTPARWLYVQDRYLRTGWSAARLAMTALAPSLRRWDRRAALTADRYLANSTVVRDRIRAAYGVDAEVVPPPPALDPAGPAAPVDGLEPGFFLCVARLLPYKNVDAILAAFADLPDERIVVAGDGYDAARLARGAPGNACFVGAVDDIGLRWLYGASRGVVGASWEDYGLTPLEAASFGRPSAVLRAGGYLDTVVADGTGVFFDAPAPAAIANAVRSVAARDWDADALRSHAAAFSKERFASRLRAIVEEELSA